ncbi:MAG: acyl-CoA dehydratase activase [bacterium]
MTEKVYVGIGVGASRVKIVVGPADLRDPRIMLKEHLGNPRDIVMQMLSEIDIGTVAGIAVTGGDGAALFAGRKIFECESIEESLRLLDLRADAILSLGGESFVAYPLAPDGRVLDYVAGNKCAAGTVEFFKQQLGRMNLTIEQGSLIAEAGKVVPLAKRCSVHCKSDCTHTLNKNQGSVSDIVHSLCHNMAEKAVGLLRNYGLARGRILVIGGASANPVIVRYLQQFLPDCQIIVPPQAHYFEALGAASIARKQSLPVPAKWNDLFGTIRSSFAFLEPLAKFEKMVTFLPSTRGEIVAGREYLLGIDGGSTTTKAALIDPETLKICASRYLKTNGNPERAMKECLTAISEQVKAVIGDKEIKISGIATTGSSGEILSVLCETPAYHNEIVAHAYGSSHFCPDVDTIFEIGGQDSKFTLLRSGVTVDFNMNESCSAGTGSFIEEAAKDDLGVAMEQIADLAIKALRPPRFSDQCAAFANTDIRKASQEGIGKEDNLAGLVYAIVENYAAKVVGDRKIGDHILFQGGTSKNKAIAYAFAAKTGKQIIVPPDSELMGCFGIVLWLREKMRTGEIAPHAYRVDDILGSTVTARSEFTCKSCDNFCKIQNLTINGSKYPFGGQCSKWENARNKKVFNSEEFDLVAKRNRMLFNDFGVTPDGGAALKSGKPVMGMLGVFSVYSYYPLYSRFFNELGYAIELSETVDHGGVRMCQSSRCYPYEIAHGTFYDLHKKGIRDIFIPHLVNMPCDEGSMGSLSCPIAQGTPYYLEATFADTGIRIHRPVLDMITGTEAAGKAFIDMAVGLGHSREQAEKAFLKGCEMQAAFEAAVKIEGKKALERIEKENRIGMVVVGRPYNAFAKVANMGVPMKFASRGITIMPYEFLPFEEEPARGSMYWKFGQTILRSLAYIKKNPRLFAVYISNFGCGPDSFIQHFANFLLDRKPMLYLELDSHTADAGIGTRAAAFLDIVSGYTKLGDTAPATITGRAAEFFVVDKKGFVRTSAGEVLPMTDPRVLMVFPSMGRFTSEAAAAAATTINVRAMAMAPVDDRVLAIGKAFTSGKECSPAVFTVGSLMSFVAEQHKKKRKDEVTLFFMPTASGPCRFGQYNVYMRELVKSLGLEDVAILSPSAADSYAGLGQDFLLTAWRSLIISDLMRDIRAILNVVAVDRTAAMQLFETEWKRVLEGLSKGGPETWAALKIISSNLAKIPIKGDPMKVPKVLLTGEIYVRSDELSRRGIEDYYADEGMMMKIADSSEWVYYTDWHKLYRMSGHSVFPSNFLSGRYLLGQLTSWLLGKNKDGRNFLKYRMKLAYEQRVEAKARRILSRSGLVVTKTHNIDEIVRAGSTFINPTLMGEAILTSGSAKVAFEHGQEELYCGVIFIGPFNCMPTGVAESVTKPYARKSGLPLLVFETDGGPMPPNFKSQMEVHVLRSKIRAKEQQSDRHAATGIPAADVCC